MPESRGLNTGNNVWMTDRQLEGTVVREAAPRSFEVEISEGVFRRNQSDLVTMLSPTGEQETPLTIEPETTVTIHHLLFLKRTNHLSEEALPPPVHLDPSWN